MIKVTVLYPNGSEAKFDKDYYFNSHIPMLKELVGDALKKVEVNIGIAGGTPDAPAPFMALANLDFESVDTFQQSFGPHTEQILGDLPNFTNVQPQVQISEIL